MSQVERLAWKLFASICVAVLCCQFGCSSAATSDAGGTVASEKSSGTVNEPVVATPQVDSAWTPPGDVTGRTSTAERSSAAVAPTSGTVFGAGDVSVKFVDIDGYRTALEKHKGKVVLVDFWATWCLACMEGFPHSVELGRKWKDKGLDVVSVSFDESDDQQKVLGFLQKQKATIENLMSLHGQSLESFVAFDIIGAALPYYKLYDRSGSLRYQFTGNVHELKEVLSTKEMDRRVEELVAEGSG